MLNKLIIFALAVAAVSVSAETEINSPVQSDDSASSDPPHVTPEFSLNPGISLKRDDLAADSTPGCGQTDGQFCLPDSGCYYLYKCQG
ncbi:hypothetical protein EW026_g4120 [Hermanssonia centrifuga]|uniref:Uncharacterized protein n=1 Tax=Hermanssonia centrifuga TaxID=98765 RepID=A0A4S4KI38_9APHY|nr:hypothetical protein EW026_g4120 [Hermanssonia centrifuga]